MAAIKPLVLPDSALLNRYADAEGCYTDCYATDVSGSVSLERYVTAFYTTPLFKLERLILRLAVSRPSTDREAEQVARGEIDQFAAWDVEDRSAGQLLMCDMAQRTRSWFMVEPFDGVQNTRTRLFFGSAVVPVVNAKTGVRELGFGFSALLGFHKLYSRALLWSAKSRLGG